MKMISRQYISEIKALFPILRKSEKKYIANLKITIEDYCEDNNVTSIEQLYKDYGTPNDVVNSYYSTIDINYLINRIRIAKHIKRFVAAILVLAIIALSAYCINLYSSYQVFEDEQVFYEETIIE